MQWAIDVAGFESGLVELTVYCTTLRGTKEVLCEFDKLTVGELVKNLHNLTESKANHHVQKAE
jgi:hypothetical protein